MPLAKHKMRAKASLEQNKFPRATNLYPWLPRKELNTSRPAVWHDLKQLPALSKKQVDTMVTVINKITALGARCRYHATQPRHILVKLLQQIPKRHRPPGFVFQISLQTSLRRYIYEHKTALIKLPDYSTTVH